MNQLGPLIIIDDDDDDQHIFSIILEDLQFKNEVLFFSDGVQALKHLEEDKTCMPFIIICDINMPKLNGMEFRDKLQTNDDPRLKCIPLIFFTTSASHRTIKDAYSCSVQGFFVKPNNMKSLENLVKIIIQYWQNCTEAGPH